MAVKVHADLRVGAAQAQLAGIIEVERIVRTSDGVDGLLNARGLVTAADAITETQPFLTGTCESAFELTVWVPSAIG